MNIEVNGIVYSGFLNASATLHLDALSSTFQFSATSEKAKPLPFRGNESCKIYVDGEKIITGYIETVNVDGSTDEHTITVAGRDSTCDIIDSSIGSLSDLRSPIMLRSIIKKVIEHLGMNIKVVDKADPAPFLRSEDLAAPEPGQSAFDFIESLARKRQVLLTSDANGNVVISKSAGTYIDAVIRHKINNDSSNNVLKYSVSYDTTARFNRYRMQAQQNPLSALLSGVSNENLVDQSANIVDEFVRPGRQLTIVAENAGSTADQVKRVIWESRIRKTRGQLFSATVSGYRAGNGELWGINRIAKVESDYAGINARMLINTVQFSITEDEGKCTTLSFVPKNAYELALAEPVVDKTGIGLFD